MIRITDAQYANLARQVLEYAADDTTGDAINDSFGFIGGVFKLNAIVYHDENLNIDNIVPLWWEAHTYVDSGPGETGVPNDFQWSELYKHFGFTK